jgi:hypothetical protein
VVQLNNASATLLFACRSVDCSLEGDAASSDGWQYPTSNGGWSSKPDTKKHSEQSGLVRRRRWVRSMHQKAEQQQQQQQTDGTVQVPAELTLSSNNTASAVNATASDAAAADSPSAKDVIAGMCNDAIAATTADDASVGDNSTATDSATADLDIDDSSETSDVASEQDDWLFDSEAASESTEHSNSDDDGVSTDAIDTGASHDDEQQLTEVAEQILLEPEPMPPVTDTAAPNIAAVPVAVLGDTLQLTQAVAASAGTVTDSFASSRSSSSALDSAAAANATTLQTSNTTAVAIAAHPLHALQQWWDREFNFRGFGIGVVKPVFAGSLFRRQDFGVGVRLPLTSHFHSWEVSMP